MERKIDRHSHNSKSLLCHTRAHNGAEGGFVIVMMLFLILVFSSLLAAYMLMSRIELATAKGSRDSQSGFNAAEAGLNIRAEQIRVKFVGYNVPSGTSPNDTNPCQGGNDGTGDYACQSFELANHEAITYVRPDPSNPINTTVPQGELYQNLNAIEYRYDVRSIGQSLTNLTEAILELRFKSRLVPIFQFAVFYNKDLEILPGPTMTLNGPVHTNGDLYLNSDNTLSITGQVSLAGKLFRGRKNTNACGGTTKVHDRTSLRTLASPCATRSQILQTSLTNWKGMIQTGVDQVTVPAPETFDPVPTAIYFSKAELRLKLHLTAANAPDLTKSATGVVVYNADDTVDATATTNLHLCAGNINARAVDRTITFYNNREGKWINMLDIDLQALFNCIKNKNLMGAKTLADTTEGGLVFHFTVAGPDSANAANAYGVRVRNAAELKSTVAGAPAIVGLTMVSDQAFYTYGNYNSVNKKPAAIMADSVNVLSGAFLDAKSNQVLGNRIPTNTTINSAILAGTDTTGNVEGTGGQGGAYNGGFENYPRFHEKWTGFTLTLLGSFVSLNKPRHVTGAWVYGGSQYEAPIRNWSYDTMFNDASKLPPLSPRFVYLRQELFVREYEQ